MLFNCFTVRYPVNDWWLRSSKLVVGKWTIVEYLFEVSELLSVRHRGTHVSYFINHLRHLRRAMTKRGPAQVWISLLAFNAFFNIFFLLIFLFSLLFLLVFYVGRKF